MKTLKYLLCAAIALSTALLPVSCEKDSDEPGAVAITKISTVTDRQTAIDKADLAQFVIIQGSGLKAVTGIRVNDIDVNLRDAFVTSDEITFSIPRIIPGEVNNLITLTTSAGAITAPLNVFIPALKVDGMQCEWTAPGQTLYVVGDFFDLYQIDAEHGKVLFGDRQLPITVSEPTKIGFELPADAVPGTIIKIQGGIGEMQTVPGQYNYMGFKVQNYDNQWNLGWGGTDHHTAGNVNGAPAPIDGRFTRITPTASQVGWIGEVVLCMSGTEDSVNNTFPEDMVANPQKYQFKFEINTQKPIKKRTIDFYFSQNGYKWDPGKLMAFDTEGKWQTITLELTDLWNAGTPANGVFQVLAQKDSAGSDSHTEDSDISIDNLRIVPKIH